MTSRRVGLIGYGDVSVVHLEAIRDAPGLELVGVADTDPAAPPRAAQATGETAVATTADPPAPARPDPVHVATAHQAPGPPAPAALGARGHALPAREAGVHVRQESPRAHRRAGGQRLVDALAAATSSAAPGTSPAASEGSASAGLPPAASEGSAALPAAPKVGICFQNRYNL